jgi:hypothetical protein
LITKGATCSLMEPSFNKSSLLSKSMAFFVAREEAGDKSFRIVVATESLSKFQFKVGFSHESLMDEADEEEDPDPDPDADDV